MDIKQLYYFTAVAQAGSYSKAAESLAVSQPTLSVTVKKLEEELGVQLFYAFNREQHLTDEGLRLWTKAKQILDLYQETLDDMKTTNKNSSGKFTLGLSPLFGACFFGDLIPNFSMETYGSCDLVMSNAGVQIVHPFEEYPFADWRKMMAIHADGAFLVSRAAYRRMKASGKGGRIVFTGSVQSFVGSKLKEPYNFAKHGVAGLAKAIAREGAEYGIYTYTICPSFIKTPLVEKQIPEQAASLGITEEEVVKNIMLRDTVDGVFTTVEDVANTLVFLSKDQGALTGQSLRLTHGWAMM